MLDSFFNGLLENGKKLSIEGSRLSDPIGVKQGSSIDGFLAKSDGRRLRLGDRRFFWNQSADLKKENRTFGHTYSFRNMYCLLFA